MSKEAMFSGELDLPTTACLPSSLSSCSRRMLLNASRLLSCFWCNPSRAAASIRSNTDKPGAMSAQKPETCPAQLKVSSVDKQTIEVKITYAENAAMSTQLYEVDVFMFFLKDLEAVTTNFYSDLWQTTRLHTPKMPLEAMAAGDAAQSLSELIHRELMKIHYTHLVGFRDNLAKHAIETATDAVVQQLRLHACMFRQSVRRAMKGVTSKLKAASSQQQDWHVLSCQICCIVEQLAETLHRLRSICEPCRSQNAAAEVQDVWALTDEYMLTEAGIALVGLLHTLDEALPPHDIGLSSASDQLDQPLSPSTDPLYHPLSPNRQPSTGSCTHQPPISSASGAADVLQSSGGSASGRDAGPGRSWHSPECRSTTKLAGQQMGDSASELCSASVAPLDSMHCQHQGLQLAATTSQAAGPYSNLSVPAQSNVWRQRQHSVPQAAEPRSDLSEYAHSSDGKQRQHHKAEGPKPRSDLPELAHSSPEEQWQCRASQALEADANRLGLAHSTHAQQHQQPFEPISEASAQAQSLQEQPCQQHGIDNASTGAGTTSCSCQGPCCRQAQDQIHTKQGAMAPWPEQCACSSTASQAASHCSQHDARGRQAPLHQQAAQQATVQSPEIEAARMQPVLEGRVFEADSAHPASIPWLITLAQQVQISESGQRHIDVEGNPSEAAEACPQQALASARQLIVRAVELLQEERTACGYFESSILDADPSQNEAYTNRIKCLKHNARASVVLQHQQLQRSFLLADVVGATVAGLAMCLAIGGIYICYRFSNYQLNPLYVLITVIAYMCKDRMKEWGKRYLEPVCVKLGFEFPDRIVKIRDSRGKKVGRCKEWAKVVGADKVDERILAMRHDALPSVPKAAKATQPERVLTYRKKMEVSWQQLDPRLQNVSGLDDIMRFDLRHFCRRMQPPQEPHYKMCTDGRGRKYVDQVQCARVYHINVVLRIRTSTQDSVRGTDYKEKSMQIQRARIIMDQDGIKRLEATDDSLHVKTDRRVLHRMYSPDWLTDVHLLSLPKVPQMKLQLSGLARRLSDNRSSNSLHKADREDRDANHAC